MGITGPIKVPQRVPAYRHRAESPSANFSEETKMMKSTVALSFLAGAIGSMFTVTAYVHLTNSGRVPMPST